MVPNSRIIAPDDRAHALLEPLEMAGDACMERFRRATPRQKSDGSRVTDADVAAEEILIAALAKLFPDDSIRSEESGEAVVGRGPGTWWIDPLDGTDAFIEGLAHWGPTIARHVDGAWEQGALYLPRLGEFWFAAKGAGAWRDGDRLGPQDPPPGDRTAVLYLPSRSHQLGPLPWPGKVRALGSTAAHLAMVAAGSGAAAVVTRWSPWDIGAGSLMVSEAGRHIVDLSGDPVDPMLAPDTPFVATATSMLGDLRATVRAALQHARGT